MTWVWQVNDKIVPVIGGGTYAIVKLIQVDENDQEVPGGFVKYAVMVDGDLISELFGGIEGAVTYVSQKFLPNEQAAAIRADMAKQGNGADKTYILDSSDDQGSK